MTLKNNKNVMKIYNTKNLTIDHFYFVIPSDARTVIIKILLDLD